MKTNGLIHMLAALLIGAVSVSRGQEPAAPKPPVVFTVMAWDLLAEDGDIVLNYSLKGKPQPVTISWRNESQPLVCAGAGPLTFTRTVTRNGKKTEEPVVTAEIPEGVTRALLVFGRNAPGAADAPLLRVRVLNNGYDVFPGQSVRFLNYSSVELGGTLGEETFSVASGGDRVVAASLPEVNRLLPFKLLRREAGVWKKLRSTGLPMGPGQRVLIFLVDDRKNPGRLEMVLLRDQVEIPPASAAPSLAAQVRITGKP